MTPTDYTLIRIEGEYAILKSDTDAQEVFIALALLPTSADIGSRIHSENFEYTLL